MSFKVPHRVRRRRSKGWKIPENTKCVTRPGPWGNPFDTAEMFGVWMERLTGGHPSPALDSSEARQMAWIAKNIEQLRGKNLACFCDLGTRCHADILLEYANRTVAGA